MGKDILNELDPDMVKEVKEVMESLKGKSEQEILESLVKLAAQKRKSNKKLTKEQSTAILQAMKEALPPNQRKKFEALLQMMQMMNM
ncbi:MAG: hypothetical protein PWP07_1154 [Epulopiscium sp.]|jgi:uncharacterized protein (DUF2267 family)|uniref:Uncharacterized protein n=1 Tax=Defluviitalea raffinosedens TaxID=1450156 RepID=A0A7C8LJY1_9FIRM|nr:hypothetical protein [Defluviitalea raffinosedens]MBZ4668007.1 hypothetical protein [Defluviitaleaceae bacterium]MDK2787929.1 hypothetical protein [Candidatus Epulonipiscium sp.]KAE9635428.1 hypothetical protein GND95_04580 [Defluviitalea raffinosedens]MBM7684332.1 uncharacterized protein (DUF2267 family) [Defluviitalea raffinosedens]HHW67608.1 hypothetical protein [Candidatus Epulonipiscium sp.]